MEGNEFYFHNYSMENGYLWSITYSRCRKDGKCETLRMELQLAVYSKTHDILIYFGEVNKSAIDKVIVNHFLQIHL